ncbi:unnamed protein product [Darwinula stevensoni]|uniref:Tex-like protein N-terminal domain-containing protein n=1 Tax=Darwinula stevensoni TaxID=69355 RepID=A0A7R8X3H9_9CRUS|nr:unnamed protein product [Darwinula stevensoni]CAG0884413.1 unnamed protein product [Darwinula stevensoni]
MWKSLIWKLQNQLNQIAKLKLQLEPQQHQKNEKRGLRLPQPESRRGQHSPSFHLQQNKGRLRVSHCQTQLQEGIKFLRKPKQPRSERWGESHPLPQLQQRSDRWMEPHPQPQVQQRTERLKRSHLQLQQKEKSESCKEVHPQPHPQHKSERRRKRESSCSRESAPIRKKTKKEVKVKRKGEVVQQASHAYAGADFIANVGLEWNNIEDIISQQLSLEKDVVCNVVKLLDEENTVPFITRYRKEQTKGMEADRLHQIEEAVIKLKAMRERARSISEAINSQGKLTASLKEAIQSAQSMSELEHLPFSGSPVNNKKINAGWVPPDDNQPMVCCQTQFSPKTVIVAAMSFIGKVHVEHVEKGQSINSDAYIHFLQTVFHNFSRHHDPLQSEDILLIPDIAHVLYLPYKPGKKSSLAERARELPGMEGAAIHFLEGKSPAIAYSQLVDQGTLGKSSEAEVETALQHIIADVICKEPLILQLIRPISDEGLLRVEVKKSRKAEKAEEKTPKERADIEKLGRYHGFSMLAHKIRPHQTLAINRGEKRNVLSVKVIVPDHVRQSITEFVKNHWLKKGVQYSTRTSLVFQSAEDAYSRLCGGNFDAAPAAHQAARVDVAGAIEVHQAPTSHTMEHRVAYASAQERAGSTQKQLCELLAQENTTCHWLDLNLDLPCVPEPLIH